MDVAYVAIAGGCFAVVLVARAAAITGARVVVRSLRAGAAARKAAHDRGNR